MICSIIVPLFVVFAGESLISARNEVVVGTAVTFHVPLYASGLMPVTLTESPMFIPWTAFVTNVAMVPNAVPNAEPLAGELFSRTRIFVEDGVLSMLHVPLYPDGVTPEIRTGSSRFIPCGAVVVISAS